MSSFLMISNYSTQSWLYLNVCWLNPVCLLLDRLHLLLFAWVKGTHFATMIEPFFVYTLFYLLGKSALFGLLSTKSSFSCLHPVPPKKLGSSLSGVVFQFFISFLSWSSFSIFQIFSTVSLNFPKISLSFSPSFPPCCGFR